MPTSFIPIEATFHAHGKLLLTGEYFVLDGALALAAPVRFGQSLRVGRSRRPGALHWKSFGPKGHCWFEAVYGMPDFDCRQSSDEAVGRRLATILRAAAAQRPGFGDPALGLEVEAHLQFPRDWGLGSSSTLLSLLAQWLQVDPFALLATSFGGSGYDLACAAAPGPILYQRVAGRPQYVHFPFYPPFAGQLFFVYLGRKQNTREGIARYRRRVEKDPTLIDRISRLTAAAVAASDLPAFEAILEEHEELVSQTIDLPRVRDRYFQDYWGSVKSLGAWGGDFVLLTSRRGAQATRAYCEARGLQVFFSYSELLLPSARAG